MWISVQCGFPFIFRNESTSFGNQYSDVIYGINSNLISRWFWSEAVFIRKPEMWIHPYIDTYPHFKCIEILLSYIR